MCKNRKEDLHQVLCPTTHSNAEARFPFCIWGCKLAPARHSKIRHLHVEVGDVYGNNRCHTQQKRGHL